MKIPRDISGGKLAIFLKRYGYKITRQTGSHIRLTTCLKGEHHITLPKHKTLKIGTLNNILVDIANHMKIQKKSLIKELLNM